MPEATWAALNIARAGDEVVLEAGAHLSGSFQLPVQPPGAGNIISLQDATGITMDRLMIVAGSQGQKRAIMGNNHNEYSFIGESGGIGTGALMALTKAYAWPHNVVAGGQGWGKAYPVHSATVDVDIPLNALAPGSYQLTVLVSDRVGNPMTFNQIVPK
ncbi:MAG: hypothetical protein ABIS06_21330 [Vicinamibacterales bacterium]